MHAHIVGLNVKTTLKRGQFLENIIFADNTIYNNSGFIDLETNYQTGDDAPVGYAPTGTLCRRAAPACSSCTWLLTSSLTFTPTLPSPVVKDIVFTGNKALGAGTGATFVCSVKDVCENITVTNNTVANNNNPWHCKYVHTFTTGGNTGEDALDACMKNSMNRTDGEASLHVPFVQRKA